MGDSQTGKQLYHRMKQKQTIKMINKTKCCFYEKTNKIGKPLATLIKGNKQTKKTGLKSIKLERSYNGHHRNTKDHKSILKRTICH